jgi:hypothetical protein
VKNARHGHAQISAFCLLEAFAFGCARRTALPPACSLQPAAWFLDGHETDSVAPGRGATSTQISEWRAGWQLGGTGASYVRRLVTH